MMEHVRIDYVVSDFVNSNVPQCCLKGTISLAEQAALVCDDSCRNNLSDHVFNGNIFPQMETELSESVSTHIQLSSRADNGLIWDTSSEFSHRMDRQSVCNSDTPATNNHSLQFYSLFSDHDKNISHRTRLDSSTNLLESHHSRCNYHPALRNKEYSNNTSTLHNSSTPFHQTLSNHTVDDHVNCPSSSRHQTLSDHTVDDHVNCPSSSRHQTLSDHTVDDHVNCPSSSRHQTLSNHTHWQTVDDHVQCNCCNICSETNCERSISKLSKSSHHFSVSMDKNSIGKYNKHSSSIIHDSLMNTQELVSNSEIVPFNEISSNTSSSLEITSVTEQQDLLHRPYNGDIHAFLRQQESCNSNTDKNICRKTVNSIRSLNIVTSNYRNICPSLHFNTPQVKIFIDTQNEKMSVPRGLTPGVPIPSVIPEEFYDIHDLNHENEDLSAEVVFSLHLRNYQIKEVLGKGISSTVRRVVDKSTGIEYAVKIIDISGEKGELAHVEQVKKDTFREINILRMCAGHPNIIMLHDIFETSTFIFLVFEICKKGELFDYLTSVVSLSEKRTRIFMRQLMEAIAFFHEKNIVHRDLKPENILLDDALNVKVSDFGFAMVVNPDEELSELCGTPGYLAPEVLAHSMYENVSGYNKEVDMWACGVIMYTLLSGAPPFWNRRQMMMLRAIMSADYTLDSPEWDDITDAPKNLIKNLLVVNPKHRLTAKQALQHPFLQAQMPEERRFLARRKFRAAVYSLIFLKRMIFYFKHPLPVSVQTVRDNPYGVKVMRRLIDSCAFGIYKHWVKRVDNQNRAALFEHALRDDWRHTLLTVEGLRA